MTASRRRIALGLSMQGYGYHQNAWRHPSVPSGGPATLEFYLDMARTAERGCFDMVFLADFLSMSMSDVPKGSLGHSARVGLEPLTLLGALVACTSNVGVVATASTTFGSPYTTARMFASLDLISGGRCGWNVVTSFQDEEACNFGSSEILEKAQRYRRAEEYVDVVAGLWDSFDPDTFMRDRESGRYFDPAKVRVLDHRGPNFRVKGPLNVPRSPQGRPLILQAGASEEGQEMAARTADVVYCVHNSLDEAKAFYRSVKGRMAKYGRRPDELKIMPGLMSVTASTVEEAQGRFREMQKLVDPMVGLKYLATHFGDLSGVPLDEPVADLLEDRGVIVRSRMFLKMARDNNYTLRELMQAVLIGLAHLQVVGTPQMVADKMEEWFEAGAADGFNILPILSPMGVHEFVDQVLPVLRKRGLVRERYEATTLRGNLGLPIPMPGEKLPLQAIS